MRPFKNAKRASISRYNGKYVKKTLIGNERTSILPTYATPRTIGSTTTHGSEYRVLLEINHRDYL